MSETAREFVSDHIAHAYDPAKAHAYYERTKKLKGRQPGSATDNGGSRPTGTTTAPRPPKMASPSGSTSERVAALKARLNRLKEVLDQLVEAAQKRSGVDDTTQETNKKKAAAKDNAPDKPKTAAQKKADAERAKKMRAAKGETSPSDEAAKIKAQIAEVEKKIADARAKLAAALQKAREHQSKPGSKPGDTPGNRPTTAR